MGKQRGYHFVQANPSVNSYYEKRRTDIPTDEHAKYFALQEARRLAQDLKGTLTCKGYWGAQGFTYVIKLEEAAQTHHPFDDIPKEYLPGYNLVADTIDQLWPWDGPDLLAAPYEFWVWQNRIQVRLSRPRGRLVEMIYRGYKVEAYHGGPNLFPMITVWGLTERQARAVWEEVLYNIRHLRLQFQMDN